MQSVYADASSQRRGGRQLNYKKKFKKLNGLQLEYEANTAEEVAMAVGNSTSSVIESWL